MLDLEQRLTSHYADVATAPSLHRGSSMAPRFAFAGLMMALVAGGAYLGGIGSSGDDVIAGPAPDAEVEAGPIDPELLRLLERAPYNEDGGFTYQDLEVARRGEIEEIVNAGGETVSIPLALTWGPPEASEITSLRQYPTAYEEAFGYGFGDIDRVLNIGFAGSLSTNTFVVIDGDASAALDRARAPAWAAQDVRTQEGPFDIRDWGDMAEVPTVTPRPSSDVRPLGQAGQLTAFDDNVTLQSASRELLDSVLDTTNGAPTLADQEQLMKGLERLDYDNSLGVFVNIAPDGYFNTSFGEGETLTGPTLWIVETGLDGSSRVVLGFLAETDVASVEADLQALIDPTVDVSQFGTRERAPMAITIIRSDEFVVIDFTPNDPTARFGPNWEVLQFIRDLLFENPEVLS